MDQKTITLKSEQEYPKQIDTLVYDIYDLFHRKHHPSDDNLQKLVDGLKTLLVSRLEEDPNEERPQHLRMSGIGKPDRQLWYSMRLEKQGKRTKQFDGKTLLNFLFGDIVELLILFLAREAGHTVENEQVTVNVDGVEGHLDCTIDGVLLDVKSASSYGMAKFKDGSLKTNDPFGYIGQISGYKTAVEKEVNRRVRQGFLAFDKSSADLVTCMVQEQDTINTQERLRHLDEVFKKDIPPKRCYSPKINDNGNHELATGCKFCQFKEICWSDSNNGRGLRVFKYSNGPAFLTKVVKEPKVEEITKKYFSLPDDQDSLTTEV